MSTAELSELVGGKPLHTTEENKDILVAFDLGYEFEASDPSFHFGLEYRPRFDIQELAARIGFLKQLYLPYLLSLGMGYALSLHPMHYQLDYAFVSYSNFALTHRFSLTIDF